ncbi:hypothetical protein PHMEG_00027682, partial [Phytophthora megakarya]
APWLSLSSDGTAYVRFNSLPRPTSHSKSLVASDTAMYSASLVLNALISCFHDRCNNIMPSTIIT